MSESSKSMRARMTTGVPGLDTVLHGGLISGAVYIIQGFPGAGKTVLANQVCFHRAASGGQSLYVTLLAESHDRMLEHLSVLDYFDKTKTPEAVYYESAFSTLEEEGLEGILRLLTHERKRRSASLIVLDGLFVLEETVQSEAEFRKFVNSLSAFARLTGTTILLLTNSARSASSPEYTMVDGWLELGMQQVDYQSYRYLQVHKYRGSGFISGRHVSNISDAGIQVLPRLENSVGRSGVSTASRDILSTGVPTLDQMIGGGVRCGSTTLLVGPSGIGKTTFGLQFMGECSREEPGLIFGFYESTEELIDKAHSLNIQLEPLLQNGHVEVLWQPSTENALDELGYTLLEAVRRRGVKRLFIDGINAVKQSAENPSRIGRYLAALTNALRAEGVTVMHSLETEELFGGEINVKFGAISAIAQNIILLRYVELESETRRTLAIVKVRNSHFDSSICEFRITSEGITVGERFRRVDDILTGHVHPRRGRGDH